LNTTVTFGFWFLIYSMFLRIFEGCGHCLQMIEHDNQLSDSVMFVKHLKIVVTFSSLLTSS
jgi:cytidine deaminase